MKLMIPPSDPCEQVFHNFQLITTESAAEYLLKVHVARRQSVSGTCKTAIDMFISILKLYNIICVCVCVCAGRPSSRKALLSLLSLCQKCDDVLKLSVGREKVRIITLQKCAFDNSAFTSLNSRFADFI